MMIYSRRSNFKALRNLSLFLFFVGFFYFYLIIPGGGSSENEKRDVLLDIIGKGRKKKINHKLPARLESLSASKEIIGDNISKVKSGSLTVEKSLNGAEEQKSPLSIEEIINYFTTFLRELHERCAANKKATFQEIWNIYYELVMETLYPWDVEYLKRMPERRRDGTIYLAIATYRDENCLNTIKHAFAKAKYPEKIYVGLVQQNCEANCKTGVLDNLEMEDTEPDEDCHRVYCESPEGKIHCDAGRVRALHVNETESLGPYAARYFGSKLWFGEEWFMQIDSHMTFKQNWDSVSIEMLEKAPSEKPVISHYPPSEDTDFDEEDSNNAPASRLCGGNIAVSDLEVQIVRLQIETTDATRGDIPKFNPVAGAGYYVASSDFLREVPYDPFLPWIFMGEEIIMSTRLWTHGYDIFSPTQDVVGHMYGRRHKPKFWENVHRVFTYGVHNPLQMMILHRIKYQLGYPESGRDMVKPKSILAKVEEYSLGTKRLLEDYLEMAGYNLTYKIAVTPEWCFKGVIPPTIEDYQQYKSLYE